MTMALADTVQSGIGEIEETVKAALTGRDGLSESLSSWRGSTRRKRRNSLWSSVFVEQALLRSSPFLDHPSVSCSSRQGFLATFSPKNGPRQRRVSSARMPAGRPRDEAQAVHRRADHRDPEGGGGRGQERRSLPTPRH